MDGELITLLALGYSARQAAERVGCSKSKVYQRKKDPAFSASLEAARQSYGETPAGLRQLYRILEDLRSGLRHINELDSRGHELTTIEVRRHLDNSVRWAEELIWLKEQDLEPLDPDSSAANLVSEVYEHQTHGDTCTCVLGEAAA